MDQDTREASRSTLPPGRRGSDIRLWLAVGGTHTTHPPGFRRPSPLPDYDATDGGAASTTPTCGLDGDPSLLSPYWRARLDAA